MARHRKAIKAPEPGRGHLVSASETVNYDQRPPVFSLERLQPGKYCLSGLDKDNKAMFADAMFRRKGVTWNEIKQQHRHGLGTEKIARSSVKAAIPPFITDEVDDFIAFRYHGKRPMVGYRVKDVFYVLWFDHDFTLYHH